MNVTDLQAKKYPRAERREAQVGEYVTNDVLVGRVDRKLGGDYWVTFVDGQWSTGNLERYRGQTQRWGVENVDTLTGKSALKAKIADLEMQLKAQPKVTYTVKGQDYADLEKELERSRTQEMLRSGERDSAVMAQDELRTELDNLKRRYEDVKRRAIDAEGKLASRRLDTSEQNLKDWIAAHNRQRERAEAAEEKADRLALSNSENAKYLANVRIELASVREAYNELRPLAVYVRRSDYDRQVKRAAEAEALAGSRGTSLAVANQDLGNTRAQLANVKAKLEEQHKVNGKLSAELGRLRAAVKDARKDIVSTVDRTLTAAVTGPKDEEPRYYKWHTCRYRVSGGKVELWDDEVRRWGPSAVFRTEDQLANHPTIAKAVGGKPIGWD